MLSTRVWSAEFYWKLETSGKTQLPRGPVLISHETVIDRRSMGLCAQREIHELRDWRGVEGLF